jgi:hypothetical protein
MRWNVFSIAIFSLAVLVLPQGAFAQGIPGLPAGFLSQQPDLPSEPPQEPPPLPEGTPQETPQLAPPLAAATTQSAEPYYGANAYQNKNRQFPPLPPSRPCAASDIFGNWKLIEVYEEPPGNALAEYGLRPNQYMQFFPDSTYMRFSDPYARKLTPEGVQREIKKSQPDGALYQYVLGESGVIYFYSQGVATDSLACFIVANQRGNFLVGQMLLMPQAGQQSSRLVKVYNRHTDDADSLTKPAPARPRYITPGDGPLSRPSYVPPAPSYNKIISTTSGNRTGTASQPQPAKQAGQKQKQQKQKKQNQDQYIGQ